MAVALAASALTAGVAAPQVAHAATTVTGTVEPGVPTTLTLTGADDAQLTVDLPAGVVPTLRITQLTAGTTLSTALVGPETSSGSFAFGDDPASWYTEYGPATTQPGTATLTLTPFNNDTITVTFTLGLARDTTVPVVPGQDVTLTFGTPGDRSLLTFDAHAGFEVTATVTSDDLVGTPANPFLPRLGLALETEFGPNQLIGDGTTFGPAITFATGPQTLVVDPGAEVTGSVTLHVDLARQSSGDLAYGKAAVPVVLDEAGLERRFGLVARSDAPTLLQAFSPDLVHADGTPGTATVELVVRGEPVRTLGTVTGSTPATFSTGTPLAAGGAVVRVVPDATTTGTFGLRATLDAAAPVTLQPAVSAGFALPGGTSASRFEVDLPAGLVEMAFGNVGYDEGTPFPLTTAFVLDPDGTLACEIPLFGTTFTTCRTEAAGTHTVELLRDAPSATNGVRGDVTVSPVTTTTLTDTLPADRVVSTTLPGQRVEVVVPGLAGQVVTARLTDPRWTVPPGWEGSAGANVTLLDDAGNSLVEGGADQFAQTVRLTADTAVHVLVDPFFLSTGSVRLLVDAPRDVTGTLVPGTTTTVTIPDPGSRAVYTVQAVAGRPLAVSVDSLAGAGDVVILDPDGGFVGSGGFLAGITSWVETAEPVAVSGTYTVVLDPTFDSTGSLSVRTILPVVTTRTVRAGQTVPLVFGPGDQQRLTFTAAAGRRPALQLTTDPSVSWQGRALLLDAAGTVLESQFVSTVFTYAEFASLPARGTYTIVVDLLGDAATSISGRLVVAADQTLTARPGRPMTVSWGTAQRTNILIPVRKGEHPAVDLRAARLAGVNPFVDVELFMPGNDFSIGQVFLGEFAQSPPVWFELAGGRVAPQDEVWRLQIVGFQGTTGSVDLVPYSVKDQTQRLTLGRPARVTVKSPVVDVRMPFTLPVTSSGTLHWKITGSTFAKGVRLWALGPQGSGSFVGSIPAGATSGEGVEFGFFGPNAYTLIVDPVEDSTGTATVTVTVDP